MSDTTDDLVQKTAFGILIDFIGEVKFNISEKDSEHYLEELIDTYQRIYRDIINPGCGGENEEYIPVPNYVMDYIINILSKEK
jgi:hypothetical protein